MKTIINKINNKEFTKDDLQILFMNFSPIDYLPKIEINLEEFYYLFLKINNSFYRQYIIDDIKKYVKRCFNKDPDEYLKDIFEYLLDNKMFVQLYECYSSYYNFILNNGLDVLNIEEIIIFSLEHDIMYSNYELLKNISLSNIFVFLEKNDYFYNEFFHSYIYINCLYNRISLPDILNLINYNNKRKQIKIDAERILSIFILKSTQTLNLRSEHVSILNDLFNLININKFANYICNSSYNYKTSYLNLLFLLREIFDEKMEQKYIRKLKNKIFYKIYILEWFLDNYDFKYESNRLYLQSILMIKKLKN